MNTIRTRIAVAAVFVGLGGLGGYAMATNPARDAQGVAQRVASTQVAANSATTSTRPVITQSSGAPAQTVPTVAQATRPTPATKPVVTHTSGAGPNRKHAIERVDGGGLRGLTPRADKRIRTADS